MGSDYVDHLFSLRRSAQCVHMNGCYSKVYLCVSLDGLLGALMVQSDGCLEVKEFEDIPPNTVNMALQIPQYFLLTCGEVVFSVTGLEFSYSQVSSFLFLPP
jgi:dipeptide/tripeptide permease